jgi:FtsZ-binding cell division protein ZapB
MNVGEETDQFRLLEDKIDSLIELVTTLRKEKESFTERFRVQEEKIADLTRQVEALREDKDRARQRVVSILEKIEQVET